MKWVFLSGICSIILSLYLDPIADYYLRGRTGDPDIMAGHSWDYWKKAIEIGKTMKSIALWAFLIGVALLVVALLVSCIVKIFHRYE